MYSRLRVELERSLTPALLSALAEDGAFAEFVLAFQLECKRTIASASRVPDVWDEWASVHDKPAHPRHAEILDKLARVATMKR